MTPVVHLPPRCDNTLIDMTVHWQWRIRQGPFRDIRSIDLEPELSRHSRASHLADGADLFRDARAARITRAPRVPSMRYAVVRKPDQKPIKLLNAPDRRPTTAAMGSARRTAPVKRVRFAA